MTDDEFLSALHRRPSDQNRASFCRGCVCCDRCESTQIPFQLGNGLCLYVMEEGVVLILDLTSVEQVLYLLLLDCFDLSHEGDAITEFESRIIGLRRMGELSLQCFNSSKYDFICNGFKYLALIWECPFHSCTLTLDAD